MSHLHYWKGSQIDWRQHGLHSLSPAELTALDDGLRVYRSRGASGKDFAEMSREDFPLDGLAPTLEKLARNIRDGSGFAMLRGLDTGKYSRDEMALMFYAIGMHIGVPIVQSHQGEYLGHVMNLSDIEPNARGYHTGGHMGMHTDSCDIVGLMCLNSARSGGDSRIVNARAIFAEIERRRPDLAAVLAKGFYFRRMEADARYGNGVVVSRERIPVYLGEGVDFSCYFNTGYIQRAQTAGDTTLSDIEQEALALVRELSESPEFFLDMAFTDGDMQFLNNRALLHGRTHYEDGEGVLGRRHLIRMWLRMEQWPALPQAQVMHSLEDRAAWRQRRVPLMDVPSVYLAEKQRQVEAMQS